jgi:hypothetical protein
MADVHLDRGLYRAWQAPYLEMSGTGAIGLNGRHEQGEAPEWRIEVQRPAADLVQAGVLRGDQELVAVGWCGLDWGIGRQGPDGGFPGSAGLPKHTTAFFVEALARAALVSVSAGAEVGPARSSALASAARWLADVESPADDAKDDELVHRWWIVAAALAQAGTVLADPALVRRATQHAARAVARQTPEGVVPELDGHDVRYHSMAVLFASRYLLALGPDAPAEHQAAVAAALGWLVPRIRADGTVDLTGSTRTGELTPNGHVKVVDQLRLLEGLVLGHHACADPSALAAAGRLVPGVAAATRASAVAPERAERPRRLSFVFVCQAGRLEPEGLLLASSLRHHLASHHEVIAAVPGPEDVWGRPSPATIDALRAMDVRVEAIENPLGPTFSHANKIPCLAVPTDADVRILVDTDMVCLGAIDDQPAFEGAVAAKPADELAYTDDLEVWRATYTAAGETLPDWRVRTTTSGDPSPPFYNTGMVVVEASLGPALSAAWLACSEQIRGATSLPHHRDWSDQLGFAVALARLGITPTALDPQLNLPLHHRPLATAPRPRLVHYHWTSVLREEPRLRAEARALAAALPAFDAAARAADGWADVLAAPRHPEPGLEPAPELLITGISRSGTSYLAALLHRYSNCVVINEPDDIHDPLHHPLPWGIATYLRRLRADVLDGRPITNKLVDGRVTEDTAVDQTVRPYSPTVDNADFVLATKNTLAYLHHLARIRAVLPAARVALCVRNPLDTLASWKTSFPHLRDVDLSVRPHAHPDDRWLTAAARERLAEIVAIDHPAWRRAHHWAFLAELAAGHLPAADLVRYDELVRDPVATVERLAGDWPIGTPREPIAPSRIRGHRSALDAEDLRAIRAVCGPAAAALGLDIG